MPYIGNVSPFESVGTSELKDGSVTAAKITASLAVSGSVSSKINCVLWWPSLGTASIIRTNANTIS